MRAGCVAICVNVLCGTVCGEVTRVVRSGESTKGECGLLLSFSSFYSFYLLSLPSFSSSPSLVRYHIPKLTHEGGMLAVHTLAWYCAGWRGLLYLSLSGGFSLGAFGHPYLGFWLIQHMVAFTEETRGERCVTCVCVCLCVFMCVVRLRLFVFFGI